MVIFECCGYAVKLLFGISSEGVVKIIVASFLNFQLNCSIKKAASVRCEAVR